MEKARAAELTGDSTQECAEVQRQIGAWSTEAEVLARKMNAVAGALMVDASRINFRGDLLLLDADPNSSDIEMAILDLAKLRSLVCNLKILQAQLQEIQARKV